MEIVNPVFIISLSYFLIGALAIIRINRRKPAGKRELWTKFLYYFLIVHTVLISTFNTTVFRVLGLIIIGVGSYEFYRVFPVERKGRSQFVKYLVPYFLIATGFLLFCFLVSSEIHRLVYLVVFCVDGFSQICGQLFGKTKLTAISPAKTLEGTLGGIAITAVTCFFVAEIKSTEEFLWLSGLILSAISGDLLASAYKRFCGVKDYSSLIPAHGGFLDRFDSFIVTGAVSFFWGCIYAFYAR